MKEEKEKKEKDEKEKKRIRKKWKKKKKKKKKNQRRLRMTKMRLRMPKMKMLMMMWRMKVRKGCVEMDMPHTVYTSPPESNCDTILGHSVGWASYLHGDGCIGRPFCIPRKAKNDIGVCG
jgi:hypothetical protein